MESVKARAPPLVKSVTVGGKSTALLMLDFLPGGYTKAAIEQRRQLRQFIRDANKLLERFET